MPKFFTPFDKAIYELFSESEEKRKKREEEEKRKGKLIPEFSSNAIEKKQDQEVPKSQFQRDTQMLGADKFTYVGEGKIGATSSDPEVLKKVEEMNHPSLVTARLIEEQELDEARGEQADISFLEKYTLATSPLDRDLSISTPERIVKKFGANLTEALDQSRRAAVIGATRGSVILPQLGQLVNKYGIGSLEQLYRGTLGEGMVDYDQLYSANTSMKLFSDESEKFIKTVDEAMNVGDLSTSAKILMYTTDFAVPLNVPGKVAKAVALTANVANDAYRVLRNLTPKVETKLPEGWEPLQKISVSPKELGERKELAEVEAALKSKVRNWGDVTKYSEVNKRILNDRAQLLKKAQKNINVVYGGRPILERIKERIKNPQGTRKSALVVDYKTGPDGRPILENKILFEQALTREQRDAQKLYNTIMNGQTVVSAGAIAGTWDSYFEGTEYQNLSYLMALTSIVANPTATMKLMDTIFSTPVGKLQNLGIPFMRLKPIDGSEVERPLNLPTLLHTIGKFVAEQTQSPDEVLDFASSNYMQRVRAMAMGVPFYKAWFYNNKDKIARLDGLTELEAVTKFSQSEFKAMAKFGDEVMPFLPKEYLDSYRQMVKYGADLEQRIKNSPYGDRTSEFHIALEQITAGIRMNAFTGILNHVSTDAVGKDKAGNIDNILLIFRTHQQELQNQIKYITDALENLSGGAKKTDNDFLELKRGADKLVAKMRGNIQDLTEQVDMLSDQKGVIANLQKNADLEELTLSESGFNLKATHGVGEKSSELRGAKIEEFGEKVNKNLEEAYEQANDVQQKKFDQLDEAIKNRDLSADEYVNILEDLKANDIDDFAQIADLLKDKQSYLAFGKFSRTADQRISYKNDIDMFISFSRYRGLENKNLDELNDIVEDILDVGGPFKSTDINFEGALPVTRDGPNFNLNKTLQDIDQHVESSGLEKQEYLRQLLSNLKTRNPQQAKELSKYFDHVAKAEDMYTLRKNHSQWAWNNRFKKAGASRNVLNSVRKLDDTFEEHGISELSEANKAYTKFKELWHESFLGKKLLQSLEDQDGIPTTNIGTKEEILKAFLTARNSKQSRKVFDELFGEYVDATGSRITRQELLEQMQKDLDSTFAFEISQGNMFRGSNVAAHKKKIDDLRNAKLISDEMAEKAEQWVDITSPVGAYKTTKELEGIENNLKRILNSITETQKENIKQSIGMDVANIKDSDSLFEFLFPKSGAATYAREATPATKETGGSPIDITEQAERLQMAAEKQVSEIENLGYSSVVSPERISKSLEQVRARDLEAITGSRFDVFLKEVYDIEKGVPVTSEQAKQLEGLRDILVSTMIRRSQTINSTRKAQLDFAQTTEEMSGLTGAWDRARASLNRRATSMSPSGVQLDTDFNIAEMMSMYENIQPSLKKLDEIIGKAPQFTDDLNDLLEGLVAIKGEVPDDFLSAMGGDIPKGLTYSAALSRLYSGFRGVVSWRYLASEQIIREHQRAKHLMFHKILTDPEFVGNLNLIINNKAIQNERKFVEKITDIMKVAGARVVVYDADKEDYRNYDPSPSQVVKALRDFWLSPFRYVTPEDIYPPKDIEKGELELDISAQAPFVEFRRGLDPEDQEFLNQLGPLGENMNEDQDVIEELKAMGL